MEDFEARQWEERGWTRQRDAHVTKLKGTVAGLVKRRIDAYQWARTVVTVVEQAYESLQLDPGETLSGPKLAQWLNDNDVTVPLRPGSPKSEKVGKARANALLHKTDAMVIDLAVLECRTLMTARALSADFEGQSLGELEERYVGFIAEIVTLGRRLRNQRPLSGVELAIEARAVAIDVAKAQRLEKPVSMAARERFWRDREPPLRKVFEG